MMLATYQMINLPAAIYLLLGCNIGTSFTAILASIGSRREAQRVGLSHFLVKMGGTALLFPFVPWFAEFLVRLTSSPAFQVANAHTFYNIGLTVLFLPFINVGVKVLKWILPDKRIPELEPKYLRDEVINVPAVAIGLAHMETVRLCVKTLRMLRDSETSLRERSVTPLDQIAHREKVMDVLFRMAVDYLTQVLRQPLNRDEHTYTMGLIHILDSLEKISDMI